MMARYFIHPKIKTFPVLGILVVLLLVGCGQAAGPGPVATPTLASSGTTANAILKHVPNGIADLAWNPSSKTLTVNLLLIGLAPSSKHPAYIYTGSCEKQGNVLYLLQAVVADTHGIATFTTMIKNVTKGIAAKGWYVNVHNGPGLSPADQFLPIVCGNVVNANAVQSVHVALSTAPPTSVGQAASGMALLALSGGTLTVNLTLSGLIPKSMHAAYIHSGSCQSQGPVMFPLTTVVADASGNANVTTTIPNVSSIPRSGWYVNVHRTMALSTSTGFDPVACGIVGAG